VARDDEVRDANLDELERLAVAYGGLGPSNCAALIARIRELEAGYRDALAHNELALGIVEDERILDKEEADEERDWIADQRAILARGAVLP
jgi:hypothetical protein